MRAAVSILLILTLSVQCVVKLGIFTWYRANLDYVATELCQNREKPDLHCEGKCFLSEQIQKVDDTEKENAAPSKTTSVEFPVFLVPANLQLTNTIRSEVTLPVSPVSYRYPAGYKANLLHPPQFLI
ncbi:MAG: hypothetical protein LPJ89_03240 [Hymenobacteraceae bacterium]|nr:hypothetical protein [Hymenobacteraceae bacterium]MDX5395887.1 hypothetical protein [Hymenobacteraceae bacterium]MDX5442777.1 hypothetical protein [Hymenobacteraceae bacterium]MDX5511942.1 hypothetical protein [Hymenobacteraceae bacterium]